MAAMVEAAVATDAAMIRSRVIHAKWADRWRWIVLQRMTSTSGFIPAASKRYIPEIAMMQSY
jgi:hypothetical protein